MDDQQESINAHKDDLWNKKPPPPPAEPEQSKPNHQRGAKPSLSVMAALRTKNSQHMQQPKPPPTASLRHQPDGLRNWLGEPEELEDVSASDVAFPPSVSFTTTSNPNLTSSTTGQRIARKRSLPDDCSPDREGKTNVSNEDKNNYIWSRLESPPQDFQPEELPVAATLVHSFEFLLGADRDKSNAPCLPDSFVLKTNSEPTSSGRAALGSTSGLLLSVPPSLPQPPSHHTTAPPTNVPKSLHTPNPDFQKVAMAIPATSRPQDDQWSERFQELCEFRTVKGHANVPHNYKDNPRLARWVKRQRHQYKQLKEEGRPLSASLEERVKALTNIGFVWDCQRTAWDEKLAELKEYKETHGNTNVPSNFPSNPQLAMWVKCQRRQYRLYKEGKKSSSMTAHRIKELEKLGFVWGMRGSQKSAKTEHYA